MILRVPKMIIAGAVLAALGACVAPDGTVIAPTPDGGIVVAPPSDSTTDRRIAGLWCFEGRRGRERERSIEAYRDGIVVTNQRGITREYRRVSAAQYREIGGNGVYSFRSPREAYFSRDGTQRNVVQLYRCR